MSASRQPWVDVMMPTYNQEGFVDEALSSAVEQNYENLRVICADDGSVDGTRPLLESWARRFPGRVLVHPARDHVGLTANGNRALAACTSELVCFFSGDDAFLPGKIERQVEWFLESPARVLCAHDVEVFDGASGAALHRWHRHGPPPAGRDLALLVRDGHASHPLGNMVRRTAIPARGFDARLPVASDWKFFVDCGSRGEFGYVPGVYARYRVWPGNVSRRRAEMLRDLFLTIDLIAADYPDIAWAAEEFRAYALLRWGWDMWRDGREVPLIKRLQSLFSPPVSAAALLKMAHPRALSHLAAKIGVRRRPNARTEASVAGVTK